MNLFLLAYLAAVAGITIASPVLPRDVDSTTSSPRVTIKQGTLVGTHLNSFDQDIFLDIPYAQPPTGQLRFRAPEPVNTSWIGDRPAVKYGNSCYHWSKAYQHGLTYSEDCLNLNIVRPSGYAGEKLPVAFWVYGGSFQSGSANLDSLNLSYPVKQSVLGGTPVLAVSVNYRMGPLGFFASSEMEKAKEMNNGLKDLVLAVRWVQENIESFGGDPAKITLWGQSAGAEAVSNLLTAYGGQLNGLFAQVVLESGSSVRLPHNYLPIETWQPQFKSILENTNCDDATDPVDCLRSLTIEKIVDVFDTSNEIVKIPYYPAVDGDFIPDWPKNLLSQGRFVKVPMLIGANMDEGTSFGPGHINTTEQLTAWLQKSYPAMENSTIDRLLELYPNDPSLGSPFGTGDLYSTEYGLQYKRGNALAGDIAMAGPRRLMAETWSNSGQTVYSYNWNQSDYKNPPYMGANHIQELIYVFDNPSDDFPESHGKNYCFEYAISFEC
jgi:carboxylesterase type B